MGIEKQNKLQDFKGHIERQTLHEGFTATNVTGVGVYKASHIHSKSPYLYEPLICLIAQGEKVCHVGAEVYRYQAGNFFINFLPMPVQTEIVEASSEQPFLSAALDIDLVRLADIILQIERVEEETGEKTLQKSSCVLVGDANEELIDVFNRLLIVASDRRDAKVLGNAIVDEIYYRILTSDHGFALRKLLNQYGQIQPVAKAVNFIHANLNKTIQVSELASLSNMSKTAFFNAFKRLMHVPPNQYIKATKLQKAQALLVQGMQANEASYHVGYNSFSQFSREYKRFFGFPPSQTAAA
ncbi:AraC family transcriptional regulator [Planctobacterium marinum]|uniref:Transcriptional regulator n=1 Tax=Planctobacterium marinum TaxID=1631968 RepID=A0AA48HGN0_9ALTE|nr:transcriptional regulator [Planctobacterium marinum]